MKKITLSILAILAGFVVNSQTTFTHNVGETVTGTNSVGCPGGDNDWARLFVLSDFSVDSSSDFTINSGAFGIQTTDGTGVSATVTIFGADADFPGSFDDTNILGTQVVPISDTAVEEFVSFDFDTPIVVPAGTVAIVYAVTTPLGNNLFLGGTVEENVEGFLRSIQCGVADYTLPTAIGFPDAHFFMTLTSDDAILSVNDTQLAEAISLFPNPTNGDLNIDFARNLGEVSVNLINVSGQILLNTKLEGVSSNVLPTSSLATGIYFAQIATEQGSTTIKFVKN